MRIFSKKAFAFHDPKGQEPEVTVLSKEFANVPDWVAKSNMFKLATKDGDVTVIEDKKDEKAAEKAAADEMKAAKEKADAEAAEAKVKAEAEEKAKAEEEAKADSDGNTSGGPGMTKEEAAKKAAAENKK